MALKMALTIIQVIVGLLMIAIIMLQSGKTDGLSGAISGGADTFLSKNRAKTWDAKLAKITKWVAVAFVVITMIVDLFVY